MSFSHICLSFILWRYKHSFSVLTPALEVSVSWNVPCFLLSWKMALSVALWSLEALEGTVAFP